MFKKITEFFGSLSFPTKDISGERLYEHLKNIGIDAEVIPEGSPDDPGTGGTGCIYSFSIKVSGLNIDAIQMNRYKYRDIGSVYSRRRIAFKNEYYIEYIIRDSGSKIQEFEGKLDGIQRQTLTDNGISLDWQDHCVRIGTVRADFVMYHETIIDKEERVKYVFLKDDMFPSLESIEDYDKKAWQVRRMLESGQFQWDQPE